MDHSATTPTTAATGEQIAFDATSVVWGAREEGRPHAFSVAVAQSRCQSATLPYMLWRIGVSVPAQVLVDSNYRTAHTNLLTNY